MTHVIASFIKKIYDSIAGPDKREAVGNVAHEIVNDKDTKEAIRKSVESCTIMFSVFFDGYSDYLTDTTEYATLGNLSDAKSSVMGLRAKLKMLDDHLEKVQNSIHLRQKYLFPNYEE